MKTPRVTDFDPDAKVPVLKSSLDQMPAIEKPRSLKQSPAPEVHISSISSKGKKPRIRKANKASLSASKSPERSYVRRTFDFYEDQISFITQESLRERLSGKEGSM